MRRSGSPRPGVLAGILALCGLVLGLLLGSVLTGQHQRSATAGAVRLIDGVPVGVEHSRAGALAATDNYLALASQSIEQDPAVFAQLVAQAYAPQVRGRTLSEAGSVRASDPQNMSNYRKGGRGIAIIAARRLDNYTTQQATVTSWLGGLVWGPHLVPRQTWNLVDTTLRWQDGRWLTEASHTDTAPAPVPAIVYLNAGNNTPGAFARLAGMTAPFYGTAE